MSATSQRPMRTFGPWREVIAFRQAEKADDSDFSRFAVYADRDSWQVESVVPADEVAEGRFIPGMRNRDYCQVIPVAHAYNGGKAP